VLWWLAGERKRLTAAAVQAIEEGQAIVSAVSVWEIAIKRALGKLDAPDDLLKRLEDARAPLLSISARHADRAGRLPAHHRDPFDRLLVAQGLIKGAALVTADESLGSYGIDIIW
jgi:PIN domain nuclease of toxin-antitoxin system